METIIKPDKKYYTKNIWMILTISVLSIIAVGITNLIIAITGGDPIAKESLWLISLGWILWLWIIVYPIIHLWIKNLSYVAVGRDRYWRFVAGQRRANNGAIVIYDRYPLPGLSVNGRPADGPRIAFANPAPLGRFTGKLAQIEEDYYHRIPGPENLMVLQVSPEVSLARKPGHSREEIEAKCLAMEGIEAGDSELMVINADRPLEQVLSQVKTSLWRLL